MRPSSKGASARGVVFQPGSSLQIWNAGQDAGGFDAITARHEVIFSEMNLGLNDGELVAEVVQSIVLSTVMLDFSGGVPVVKVGNGATEGVIGRGRSIE
jgi:hypothetical protein